MCEKTSSCEILKRNSLCPAHSKIVAVLSYAVLLKCFFILFRVSVMVMLRCFLLVACACGFGGGWWWWWQVAVVFIFMLLIVLRREKREGISVKGENRGAGSWGSGPTVEVGSCWAGRYIGRSSNNMYVRKRAWW